MFALSRDVISSTRKCIRPISSPCILFISALLTLLGAGSRGEHVTLEPVLTMPLAVLALDGARLMLPTVSAEVVHTLHVVLEIRNAAVTDIERSRIALHLLLS